uniref:PPM-type phosphatase domain-containing protein n=1 Tax=Hyaloperonospora arabidopsidis (strain Emoy2) TaxID=559515 RepID=M4B5W0_HYAAE
MATSLDLAGLQFMAQSFRSSFLIQALMVLVLGVVLRYVIMAWRAGLEPYEVETCPPINPHVHYRYGVSQMQGRRPYMEDRHTAVADLNGDPTQSFYGIFDGHGGDGAANYCVQAMCQNVIREPSITKEPAEALKSGFLRTDQEYLQIANSKNSEDGTTAVVVFTQGNEMFVAHAGDSRAVLVHRSGDVSVLTSDHKPNRPDERRRIQELGGSVVFWGVWRVEGILAVSRAIGDRMLKPLVVAEPEVKELTRTEEDQYLVLASDGVWDTVSNDEVAQLVLKYEDPQTAAQHLMEEAYARGSMDNICVMVIDLRV